MHIYAYFFLSMCPNRSCSMAIIFINKANFFLNCRLIFFSNLSSYTLIFKKICLSLWQYFLFRVQGMEPWEIEHTTHFKMCNVVGRTNQTDIERISLLEKQMIQTGIKLSANMWKFPKTAIKVKKKKPMRNNAGRQFEVIGLG